MGFLETDRLTTHFSAGGRFLERLVGRETGVVTAVDGVSLSVARGEIFGVVGESGSGKTTLGRSVLRLVRPTSGRVLVEGTDVLALSERQFRPWRRRMQMVFQDPNAALNPAMTVGRAVSHPLRIHGLAEGAEARRRTLDMLERVGLEPANRYFDAFPSDLSGGQKQRVVIARALVTGPEVVVADEPVSMLDMSVRAKILSLLLDLQRDLELTMLFITHDLATAKLVCRSLAILYLGQVVEQGPAAEVYATPRHPYTRALLAAIPDPDPSRRRRKEIPAGEIPDAVDPPRNCRFHPRCPRAFQPCGFEGRDLVEAIERRWTGLSEDDFAAERAVLGDARRLVPDGYRLVVPVGRRPPGPVAELLERIVAEDRQPVFATVTGVRAEARAVVVELRPGVDPVPVEAGGATVACHLFPPAEPAGPSV